jgi:hypothetical protein
MEGQDNSYTVEQIDEIGSFYFKTTGNDFIPICFATK